MQKLLVIEKNNSGWESAYRRILIVTLALLFLCPLSVFAQCDTSWQGGASGNWSVSGNWNNGIPANNNTCISTSNSAVLLDVNGTTNNLTLGSSDSLTINNGLSLTVNGGTISNAGNIELNSTGNMTEMLISGNMTLSGGGTLTMSNNSNNFILGTGTLNNQGTIQGEGTIGNGLGLTNEGTIDAIHNAAPLILNLNSTDSLGGNLEATLQGTLVINGGGITGNITANGQVIAGAHNYLATVEVNDSVLNNASISAIDAGLVVINNSTLNNSSGSELDNAGIYHFVATIEVNNSVLNDSGFSSCALDSSALTCGIVELNGVTMNGGELSAASGTGGMATIFFGGTLNGVTLDGKGVMSGTGTLNGGSNSAVLEGGPYTLLGGFTNTGTIENSVLTIASTDINFGSTSNIKGVSILASSPGDTLTNQGIILDSTIGGGGLVFVNSGTVSTSKLRSGSVVTSTLEVQNVTDTNSGLIAGTIIGSGSAVINNAGGIVENGSIEDVTINGGKVSGKETLNSATINDATFTAGCTVVSKGNSTISGGTSAATFQVSNGSSLTLAGGFTNTGKIQLQSSGTATQLLISGNETLAGTISLSNDANNVIQGASTGNEVLTIKGTLEGSGNIGNGFMGLVNSGTILANQSTALTIDPSSTGFSNLGKLTVNGGSTLNITGPANSFTDTGTVKILSGGTLAMGSNLNFTQTKGTTTVDGTLSVTSANSIDILAGTLFGNNGTLDGNFILNATGVLNPGDGSKKIGDLTIDGTYTQEGTKSSLTIDLGGTTADTGYSVLNITNAASLGGKLVIDLVNGFTPAVGDTFDILDYSSETGTFSTTTLPKLSGGDTWSISYNSTGVVLTVDGPGAGHAASATSAHNNLASTVRHPVAVYSAITGDDMRTPSAILTRAETCDGFRTFASFSCMREAVSGLANSGVMHAVASHGTAVRTLHNNVATVSMSGVGTRAASPHVPTASAVSLTRFYVCAYLPSSVVHTFGCN